MADLIDRQAAIDAIVDWAESHHETPDGDDCIMILLEVPPAQPQRTGRWVFDENDFLTKCSECGCHPWFGVIPTPKEATKKLPHCPMCLVKMEGENESD